MCLQWKMIKVKKVTIENPILSIIDDEFPTIDIISPLKSPVKSAAVAQDVDKSLKPKYKAKDFHKISSENRGFRNKIDDILANTQKSITISFRLYRFITFLIHHDIKTIK